MLGDEGHLISFVSPGVQNTGTRTEAVPFNRTRWRLLKAVAIGCSHPNGAVHLKDRVSTCPEQSDPASASNAITEHLAVGSCDHP